MRSQLSSSVLSNAENRIKNRNPSYEDAKKSDLYLAETITSGGLEEFLGHCARDKAGIGWDGWKDAELYTYQTEVVNESEL